MNQLNNLVLQTIDNYKKEQNLRQFQFEKNKLYAYLGDLVDSLKKHQVIIAGGTITSLFTGTEINDIDLYFRNEESAIAFIEEHWEDKELWVTCLTKKSVLLIKGKEPNIMKVQMIHFKYFERPEEIFNSFDFTVCMGAFDFADEQFHLHDDFMKHNSQRILKFNPNTDFPIVSLLRVHKYSTKKYTISKPEMVRIILKCATLDIDTIDKLKDHLGGMYGINYDKIINLEEGEIFSLDLIIEKIANIALSEDYFKKPVEIKFEDIDEIIEIIQKKPSKYFNINEKYYRINTYGEVVALKSIPVNGEKINPDDFFKNKRFYKWVKKISDGKYVSHYDNGFDYADGEIATAKNKSLYMSEKRYIDHATYNNQGVLIEVSIEAKDFQDAGKDKVTAKSLKVIREVPQEEYEE